MEQLEVQPHPVITRAIMKHAAPKPIEDLCTWPQICACSAKVRWGGLTGCEMRSDSSLIWFFSTQTWINQSQSCGSDCPTATYSHGGRSWDKGSCCHWGRRSWCGGPLHWLAASVSTDWPRSCLPRRSAVKKTPEQRTRVGMQPSSRFRKKHELFYWV